MGQFFPLFDLKWNKEVWPSAAQRLSILTPPVQRSQPEPSPHPGEAGKRPPSLIQKATSIDKEHGEPAEMIFWWLEHPLRNQNWKHRSSKHRPLAQKTLTPVARSGSKACCPASGYCAPGSPDGSMLNEPILFCKSDTRQNDDEDTPNDQFHQNNPTPLKTPRMHSFCMR